MNLRTLHAPTPPHLAPPYTAPPLTRPCRTSERAKKQHLDGYSSATMTAKLRELREEALGLRQGLGPLYGQILLQYSDYSKPQKDRWVGGRVLGVSVCAGVRASPAVCTEVGAAGMQGAGMAWRHGAVQRRSCLWLTTAVHGSTRLCCAGTTDTQSVWPVWLCNTCPSMYHGQQH
jgi:hypothetical protein